QVNAASVLQDFKTLADYTSYLNTVARYQPPKASGSGTPGFSAVTHIGTGSGTVTPTGATSGGLFVAIQMISGGAVGTATFQYSTDGGANWSSTQTTAATFAIGATGIIVVFSGSFVITDLYLFRQVFTPMAQFIDSAGNGRFLIDHNGFPLGRLSE